MSKLILKDMEKYNTATLDGWRVLRVSVDDVKSGRACELVRRATVLFPAVAPIGTAPDVVRVGR